jgi:hypothetical protein
MRPHSQKRIPLPQLAITCSFTRLASLASAALILAVADPGPALTDPSMASPDEVAAIVPPLNAVAQNTPGYSQAYPAGVPRSYSWCNGSQKPIENSRPPSDFTAVTGLSSVYPKFGAPDYSNLDAKIIVANAKTYVRHRDTKEWLLVQDQSQDELVGATFDANGSKDSGAEMRVEFQPDDLTIIESPPPGRNVVLWMAKRGTFTAGSVDAVYVQIDMKTTDPQLKLVANVGADWWRGSDSTYEHGISNNRGAGNSNWVELSTGWSTLYFFSGSTPQFAADLPPALAQSAISTEPPMARRAADSPSPCMRTLKPR